MVGALSAHVMMGEASELFIHQWGQFRERCTVSLTPALQEFRHSLLRDRSRLHNVFLTLSPPKSFCTRKPLRKILNSDEHFDRPFSFVAVKGKPRNPNKRKRKEDQ